MLFAGDTMLRHWQPWVVTIAIPLVFALGWVGYYGSDDSSYLVGIWGWHDNGLFVGKDHWSLRHTVVIPVAVLFKLFGASEFTLVLPTLVCAIGIVILVYSILEDYFDRTAAVVGALLVLTLPLVATLGTTVVPEFVEAFYCLLALRLFLLAIGSEKHTNLLMIGCGAACGFAWITRETTAFFFVGFGLMFLFSPQVGRARYFLIFFGFLGVACLEWLYFLLMVDDPLYRLRTDLQTHLKIDLGKGTQAILDRGSDVTSRVEGNMYGELSRTGNVSVNRLLDPILAILANQEFMFYFYFSVPAAFYFSIFRGRRSLDQRQKNVISIVCLFGATWFFFLFLQFGMTLLPRYYLMLCLMLSVPLALACVQVWRSFPYVGGLLILGFVAVNLAGIYIDNRNPMFGERALAAYLKDHPEGVFADPETARRGIFLYDRVGVRQLVAAGAPKPGTLFYYNPRYVELGQQVGGPEAAKAKFADYRPQPTWIVVAEFQETRKLFGVIIQALGLKTIVPKEIFRRLDLPNPKTTLYRVL